MDGGDSQYVHDGERETVRTEYHGYRRTPRNSAAASRASISKPNDGLLRDDFVDQQSGAQPGLQTQVLHNRGNVARTKQRFRHSRVIVVSLWAASN